MSAVLLHTLTIPCSGFLLLMDADLNQQTKAKISKNRFSFLQTVSSVKAQSVVLRGAEIFIMIHTVGSRSFLITGDRARGFFFSLNFITISFVLDMPRASKRWFAATNKMRHDLPAVRFVVRERRDDWVVCKLCDVTPSVSTLTLWFRIIQREPGGREQDVWLKYYPSQHIGSGRVTFCKNVRTLRYHHHVISPPARPSRCLGLACGKTACHVTWRDDVSCPCVSVCVCARTSMMLNGISSVFEMWRWAHSGGTLEGRKNTLGLWSLHVLQLTSDSARTQTHTHTRPTTQARKCTEEHFD